MVEAQEGVYVHMPERFTTTIAKPREAYFEAMDLTAVSEIRELHTYWSPEPDEFDPASNRGVLSSYQSHLLSVMPQREREALQDWSERVPQIEACVQRGHVTQGAISHRLSSAWNRLQALRSLPDIAFDLRRLTKALNCYLGASEVDLVVLMTKTWCQASVGKIVGTTQSCVHHRLLRIAKKLDVLEPSNGPCSRILQAFFAYPYLLREHLTKGSTGKSLWKPFTILNRV
jgi:hypothetical protein